MKGSCTAGANCGFWHPKLCQEWKKGQCQHGSACPLRHQLIPNPGATAQAATKPGAKTKATPKPTPKGKKKAASAVEEEEEDYDYDYDWEGEEEEEEEWDYDYEEFDEQGNV